MAERSGVSKVAGTETGNYLELAMMAQFPTLVWGIFFPFDKEDDAIHVELFKGPLGVRVDKSHLVASLREYADFVESNPEFD